MFQPVTAFQPVRALRAVAALVRDPEDTTQVFTIIDALSGDAPARLVKRLEGEPGGRRLLAKRPDIVPLLSDRAALGRLPEGTLGRAYLAFVESEGITADGLLEASKERRGQPGESAETAWMHQRLRDTHDLWHAVLGYRGDMLGESAILAFSAPQTMNPGIALIATVALHKTESPEHRRFVLDGFRRGLVAAWFPAQDWEHLLTLPVAEVRRRLRVDDPPEYTPVRPAEYKAAQMAN